jgi:general stress protein YciG
MASRYDDYGREDDDRGRSRRGFAAMEPERRREIARMGGRASHGGQGRDWDDDDDRRESSRSSARSRYDEDDDERGGRSSSRRGFAGMDPERQREIASMGGRASHGGQGRDWEDDDDDRRESSRSRGRSRYDEDEDDDRGGRSFSRRGFAGMDPERQREIASMGGRASHGGRGGDWDDDDRRESSRSRGRSRYDEDEDDDRGGRSSSRRGFAGMDPERQREIASMGGRASHGGRGRDWDDDDDDRRESSRSRGRSRNDEDEDDDRGGRSSSRRGFAAMDPERQREIASMGGRASHGGRGRDSDDDDDDRRRSSRSSRRSRYDEDEDDDRGGRSSSQRGFAAMDPERQREIASMGGRASHGGRSSR